MRAFALMPIFIASLLLQLIAYDTSLGIYDEGIILSGAEIISKGGTPYRDFWTIYGPAQFYLVSWSFDLFADTDFVARSVGILFKSWISVVVFLICRELMPRMWAATTTTGVTFFLIAQRNDLFPIFPAIALGLTSVHYFNQGLNEKNLRRHLLAGLFCGCLTLFRHDMGFYTATSIFLASTLLIYESKKSDIPYILKANALGAVGFCATLPVWAFLLTQVPYTELLDQLIISPANVYPQQRSLPFPTFLNNANIKDFLIYLPFISAVIFFFIYPPLSSSRQQPTGGTPTHPNKRWLLSAITLLGLLFSLKGIVRVSILHMTPAIIVSIITASFILRNPPPTARIRMLTITSLTLFALLFTATSIKGLSKTIKGVSDLIKYPDSVLLTLCRTPEIERLRCATMPPDYMNAAKYVISNTKKNEPLFVGAGVHDRLFITPVALYFATGRPTATKWMELHPGVATTFTVQQKIVDALDSKSVRLLVLDANFELNEEPNLSSVSSRVFLLDEYIKSHYKTAARFGKITIMKRIQENPHSGNSKYASSESTKPNN